MVVNHAGGPEVFESADIPIPHRVISELEVRVAAAGINPIDAKTRAGGGAFPAISAWPAVLGVDFAGTVSAASFEAHPLGVGTPVFGLLSVPRRSGSYAEYVTPSPLEVAVVPDGVPLVTAAALPCAGLTAWGAVVDVAKAAPGMRILIHAGAGGVGHLAVQLAKRAGAWVATTASASRTDWLKGLGADEVIDYRNERFEDAVREVDVVIDLIGNVAADTGTRSLTTLVPGGLIINVPSGSWPTLLAEAKDAGVRATTIKALPDGRVLAELAALVASGELQVHVEEVFPLERVADAHRTLEGGHTRGKLVLQVEGPASGSSLT